MSHLGPLAAENNLHRHAFISNFYTSKNTIVIKLSFLTQGVFFTVIMIYFHQEYKNNGENDCSVEIRHIEGSTKASYESVSPHYCNNHSRGKFYAETFNQTCHHCCTT